MSQINFQIEWPDGSKQTCYSPSLVVKKIFTPGKEYELEEFVDRSRTACNIASDRVREAYGFVCSRALGQLEQIETKALQYQQRSPVKVRFLQFM